MESSSSLSPEDFALVVENSFDGIWINDGEGRILYLNKVSADLFGLDRKEVMGKTVASLVAEGVLDKPAVLDAMKTEALATKEVPASKTGKTLLCTANPIFKNGRLFRIISNVRDITAESELRLQIDNLKMTSQLQLAEIKELRNRRNLVSQSEFIFKSKVMQEVNALVQRAALSEATMLIEGESGTGKGVLAKLIHTCSARKHEPFIIVNCAAIPPMLIESELFGYKKGAFTDAKQDKIGMFELANKGTLFLDEIGELPLPMQTKLLHAIQERQIQRIGDVAPIKLNIRIVAATNIKLSEAVQKKEFRADLFYRLNVIHINIPPLRERREDILPLSTYFLGKMNTRYSNEKVFNNQAIRQLEFYDWPGNTRELENTIERTYILSQDRLIADISFPTGTPPRSPAFADHAEEDLPEVGSLKAAVDNFEKKIIIKALNQYKSMRNVAKYLGTDHATISRKVKKHGIKSLFTD